MKVRLQVYDLSQGLARAMGAMLTGKTFEAIYHTGVAVDSTEYYFSAGIQSDTAGQTRFGTPMEEIDMGETGKSEAEIKTFLDSIQSRYTETTYNLIEHNCNHFSNEFLGFLCNKEVPAHILSQGLEFLATPLGKIVAPILQSNILGIPGAEPSVSAAPSHSPKPQQKKTSIFIEKPLVLSMKQETLHDAQDKIIAHYGALGLLQEGTTLQSTFSELIRAIGNRSLYAVDPAAVKSLCKALADEVAESGTKSADFLGAAFYFLSSVCLSESQNDILDSCLPLPLMEHHDALPKSTLEPLYHYVHNWLIQLRGMRDFRSNTDKYLDAISKLMASDSPVQRLYGHRLLYTASRIFTKQMAVDNYARYCAHLAKIILTEAEKGRSNSPTRKAHIQIANLTAGALGRLTLTANDKGVAGGWYETVEKELHGVDLAPLAAPCCTDLQNHVREEDHNADLF